MLSQAPNQGLSGGTGALYALLGVFITGVVALLATAVKSRLDAKADSAKHNRQKEIDELNHIRAMEKLQTELQGKRTDALEKQRVETLARFLVATLAIYQHIRLARNDWKNSGDDRPYEIALRSLDASEGQLAFEELRLTSNDAIVGSATALWRHLRKDVALGERKETRLYNQWRDSYWRKRQELIQLYREQAVGLTAPPEEKLNES